MLVLPTEGQNDQVSRASPLSEPEAEGSERGGIGRKEPGRFPGVVRVGSLGDERCGGPSGRANFRFPLLFSYLFCAPEEILLGSSQECGGSHGCANPVRALAVSGVPEKNPEADRRQVLILPRPCEK